MFSKAWICGIVIALRLLRSDAEQALDCAGSLDEDMLAKMTAPWPLSLI